jgi:hypothetical protein
MSEWKWRNNVDRKETFFETEKGGRILRLGVHLRPKKEGNILWYLSTKTKLGHWAKFYLTLDEMEQLGLLFLLVSRFCEETMWMNKESFTKIQNLKKVWEHLTQISLGE